MSAQFSKGLAHIEKKIGKVLALDCGLGLRDTMYLYNHLGNNKLWIFYY